MRTPHNEQVGSDIPVDPAERTCVLSGRKAARDELIRLAISVDGEVFPDALAKAEGRGAWLGVARPELEAALAKGKFTGAMKRAFKGAPISVSNELPAMIEAALTRAFTDRLGLELRTGKLLMCPTGSRTTPARAKSPGWPTPPTPARTAAASSTRLGAWAKTPRGRVGAESDCRWTARLCLWHWAATTSSIWR